MGEPSRPPARSNGLRLLMLVTLVAALGLLAVSRWPGTGALVAQAWSAAAPAAVRPEAPSGRLGAAEAQSLAAEAEEAWQRGDWAGVAESLTALAAAGPRTRVQDDRLYEAELNLGWALLAEGQQREAEAHLATALEARPGGQEALEGLRIAQQPLDEARPAASSESTFHVVQTGDTLFALARRFATTVEAIKAANGLPCNKIVVGQKLVIPACVPACSTPVVQVVCVPVCPTPVPQVICVPVCPVVVCVPVCPTPVPQVICVPVCPTPVCVPVCPTPTCVPIDP